jgi:hypothetical protein
MEELNLEAGDPAPNASFTHTQVLRAGDNSKAAGQQLGPEGTP